LQTATNFLSRACAYFRSLSLTEQALDISQPQNPDSASFPLQYSRPAAIPNFIPVGFKTLATDPVLRARIPVESISTVSMQSPVVATPRLLAVERVGVKRKPPPNAAPPASPAKPKKLTLEAARAAALKVLCRTAAKDIGDQLKGHNTQYASLIPGVDCEDMIAKVFEDVLDSAPPGTKTKNGADWEKWSIFCASAGVPAWRGDLRAHGGVDPAGYWGECFLQAAAFMEELRVIQPRSKLDPAAKPASVTLIDTVRRIHKYFGVSMAPPKIMNGMLKSANVRFIENHGQSAFDPNRKAPYTNEQLAAICLLPRGTVLDGVVVSHECRKWRSLELLVHYLAQTGMRKADALNLNIDSVVFEYRGHKLTHIDRRVVDALDSTCWAIGKPGKSKSDPLGKHWAPFPVYLPVIFNAPVNAAKQLYQYYADFPVGAEERKSTPLFTDENGVRLTTSFLAAALKSIFKALPPAMGLSPTTHSWHSFRIHLACALKAAGADNDRIKSMVRWVSDDSLNIYARDNRDVYGEWLRKASVSDVRSVTVASLPVMDDDMAFAVLNSIMEDLSVQ
jgi:hypothetical protein